MNLISIPALQDNYIWILVYNDKYCSIFDPGEAAQVLKIISKNKWQPREIFVTHHHDDHVNGIIALFSQFPNINVYGPKEAQDKGVTHIVYEGETIILPNCKFSILATPGHTLGHLCFFSFPYLFCGDTLFSGGCGRIFEGTYNQMYQSLQKINQLPDDTLVCCAHEYTLANMKFALTILPNDLNIQSYHQKVNILRMKNRTTLPVTLKHERKINLFLRLHDSNVIREISKSILLHSSEECFAFLRSQRDNF